MRGSMTNTAAEGGSGRDVLVVGEIKGSLALVIVSETVHCSSLMAPAQRGEDHDQVEERMKEGKKVWH
jgi:hypothetical protein